MPPAIARPKAVAPAPKNGSPSSVKLSIPVSAPQKDKARFGGANYVEISGGMEAVRGHGCPREIAHVAAEPGTLGTAQETVNRCRKGAHSAGDQEAGRAVVGPADYREPSAK